MTDTDQLLELASQFGRRHLTQLDDRPVMPTAAALEALRRFHEPLPQESTPPEHVLRLLDELGSPAAVASPGGRFFGYVVGGALPISVAANWLAGAWDQNAGSYVLAPAAAELEEISSKWILELLDLPHDAVVGFVTGSTMGTFAAIAAARSALLRRAGYDVKRHGLTGASPLRIVASADIHPTNIAALGYAGFGIDQVEACPVDDQGRMIADEMPALDARTIVLTQAGSINSGASDPFEEICDAARRVGAWVHVDGAFGLWARASAAKRDQLRGVELADSWSVDGHKWLNIPQDSAIYACRDIEAINDVFGVRAIYLNQTKQREPNTLTPELSRRARGIEFWAALKSLGRRGVEDLIDRTCALAVRFADGLSAAGYEVLNDVVLNQVVFSCVDETRTKRALAFIQASGTTWLGPTQWRGRFAMRISVSSWATTEADVDASLGVMAAALGQASSS